MRRFLYLVTKKCRIYAACGVSQTPTNIHKARSLRRAKNSTNAKAEKRIIAVLAKKNGENVYGELVYLSSIRGVYEKNEALLEKMDDSVMMRFMEILTRPD